MYFTVRGEIQRSSRTSILTIFSEYNKYQIKYPPFFMVFFCESNNAIFWTHSHEGKQRGTDLKEVNYEKYYLYYIRRN